MAMIVEAKTSDPVQLKLRSRKRGLNIAIKEFKTRLNAFQSGLNGRGSPEYNIPPSDIKEPLPSEVGAFMRELVANFQQLMGEAKRIEAEQAAYSAKRQKAKPSPLEVFVPKKASIVKQAFDKTMKQGLLRVGDYEVPTLLALTEQEQQQGLMEVSYPPPVMTFVYGYPQVNRFWMKNTPSPLDIVFSLRGKITAIHKGEPYSTAGIGDPYTPSDLIAELPYGTCKSLGITIGDPISLLDAT